MLSLLLVYALLLQFIPAFHRVTLARTLPDRSAPATLNPSSKPEPERWVLKEPLEASVPPATPLIPKQNPTNLRAIYLNPFKTRKSFIDETAI